MSLENDYKTALESIANDVGSTAKQLREKAKSALNPVIEYEEVDVVTWVVVEEDGEVVSSYKNREAAEKRAADSTGLSVVKSLSTKVRPKKKQ